MTKQKLLERINREWEQLATVLSSLDDDAKLEPRSPGGRSIKDVMGRISGWESVALERLGRMKRREPIELIPDEQVEEWNRKFYELRRDWKLMIVEGEFENVHVRLLQEIERLDDAVWDKNESQVHEWLPTLTFGQYAMHSVAFERNTNGNAKGKAR
ncbi:MAG: ClbS/DfsB family four-helix bundle protein [Ignavibacteriae bacterium]|nr:ClbS/DfsB family four-helix bundle protein [Ignavibacteriota bacterium]